jgi:hypothetical protein
LSGGGYLPLWPLACPALQLLVPGACRRNPELIHNLLTGDNRGGVTALVGINPDDYLSRSDRDLLARLSHTLPPEGMVRGGQPDVGSTTALSRVTPRPGADGTQAVGKPAPSTGGRVTTSVPSAPSEYEGCRSSSPLPNVTRRVWHAGCFGAQYDTHPCRR